VYNIVNNIYEVVYMSIFNKRVKELRSGMNLSLRQLSELSGLSSSAIHAYEIGSREPTLTSLEALCDVFNCDVDYLLGKTDVKNAAANILGAESLYAAYESHVAKQPLNLQLFANETAPTEPKLSEGEEMLLKLFRKLPQEAQNSYIERLEEALKTLGLI
jgi:transcriptional regulator with XRE-family HTH domain